LSFYKSFSGVGVRLMTSPAVKKAADRFIEEGWAVQKREALEAEATLEQELAR
jgi:hypothetical protein